MCIIYFAVFVLWPLISPLFGIKPMGHFAMGRMIDLAQLDIIGFFLWRIFRFQKLNWKRLKEREE